MASTPIDEIISILEEFVSSGGKNFSKEKTEKLMSLIFEVGKENPAIINEFNKIKEKFGKVIFKENLSEIEKRITQNTPIEELAKSQNPSSFLNSIKDRPLEELGKINLQSLENEKVSKENINIIRFFKALKQKDYASAIKVYIDYPFRDLLNILVSDSSFKLSEISDKINLKGFVEKIMQNDSLGALSDEVKKEIGKELSKEKENPDIRKLLMKFDPKIGKETYESYLSTIKNDENELKNVKSEINSLNIDSTIKNELLRKIEKYEKEIIEKQEQAKVEEGKEKTKVIESLRGATSLEELMERYNKAEVNKPGKFSKESRDEIERIFEELKKEKQREQLKEEKKEVKEEPKKEEQREQSLEKQSPSKLKERKEYVLDIEKRINESKTEDDLKKLLEEVKQKGNEKGLRYIPQERKIERILDLNKMIRKKMENAGDDVKEWSEIKSILESDRFKDFIPSWKEAYLETTKKRLENLKSKKQPSSISTSLPHLINEIKSKIQETNSENELNDLLEEIVEGNYSEKLTSELKDAFSNAIRKKITDLKKSTSSSKNQPEIEEEEI